MSTATDRRTHRSSSWRSAGQQSDRLELAEVSEEAPRLLERNDYLSEMRVLLSSDWDRPVGPLVIEGRTGLGKTALLGAACQIALDAGSVVLRARTRVLCEGPCRSLTDQLLDSIPHGLPSDSTLGAQPVDRAAELWRQVSRLAGEGGIVIAVDDAQYLDEQCVELLRHLQGVRGRRRTRLILSVALRPMRAPLRPVDLLMSEPGVRVMSLAPLSCSAVALLMDDCLGQRCDEPERTAFARSCHEATDGIPALVIGLLAELATQRVLPTQEAVRSAQTAISAIIARSVLERLSRLPEDATAVLETVAVAEEPADLELIGLAAKLSSTRVLAAARLLAAVDLVRPGSDVLQMTPLLRRTVYEEIDLERRSKLHLAVARQLKVRAVSFSRVADHLVASQPGHKEWVARELFQAASRAMRKGEDSQALRYLRRAFAEHPTAWENPDQLLDLVRAEMATDSRAAVEHLVRSLDCGADPTLVARLTRKVALWLADSDILDGRNFETRTSLVSVMDRACAMLPVSKASERIELGIARALAAEPPLALAAADAVRDEIGLSPSGTQADHKAAALLAIADSVSPKRARQDDIVMNLRQVLLEAQLCNEDPVDCQLGARALLALVRAGEFALADRFARHAQAMSNSRGLLEAQAEYSLTLAMSLHLQGSIIEASENARHSLAVAGEKWWNRRPDAVSCLVASLVDQGQLDEAESLLVSYRGLESQVAAFEGPSLLVQRGRLRNCQGRLSEALADLLAAGSRADETQVDSPAVTTWRSEAAELLARQGREAEAGLLAETNLELARAHGAEWVLGSALRVAALVGPKEERLERLEESVRLLDGSPARLLLATAFIDLGEALRRSGQPMAVSTLPLRRGLDIAFGLQAAPLVSRALNELKLSGARPRRTAVSGPGSLTPAEGRVVALAANGCTNSAIASELFLTEKTVEGHLVRSYRKLKVRSRRELKALLQSPERQPHDPNVKGPGPTTAQDAVAGRPAVQRLLADDDAGIALDDLMGKEQIPADSRKQSAPGTGRTT